MKKNILIFCLFFTQIKPILSIEKVMELKDLTNSDKYMWKEVGQIECVSCSYISFSEDNKLLTKSSFVTLSCINIKSYEQFEYDITPIKPQKFVGFIGLFFVPSQYFAISSNGLYKAEIILNENEISAGFIKVYKKVLISNIINERFKKFDFRKTVIDNFVMSSICAIGILSLATWHIKKKIIGL